MVPDSNLTPISFNDLPEDVQLCILSFLNPTDIASFACTSKRSLALCRTDSKLWYSLCNRKWGFKTHIRKWANGSISYKFLYNTLCQWDSLIGFWRRSGQFSPSSASIVPPPQLVLFEWGPSYISGSRVCPAPSGAYSVVKTPFLFLSINRSGEIVNFIDPDGKRSESSSGCVDFDSVMNDDDLVSVNVNFMGTTHFVVEENVTVGFGRSSSSVSLERFEEEGNGGGETSSPVSSGSLPDRYMSDMYQYFANRTSPGGNGSARRQRKREKERQGRRKWEPEHFVKIVDCCPTDSRPLQGLWKGIGDDLKLGFYLVTYDDIGGLACRIIGESMDCFSGSALVFWTSKATFTKRPFSPVEEKLYNSRMHLHPLDDDDYNYGQLHLAENDVVSHILHINSSHDLVTPARTSQNPQHLEGRIWLYENGTFGFGFLQDNFIINLKHIFQDDCLLDSIDLFRD